MKPHELYYIQLLKVNQELMKQIASSPVDTHYYQASDYSSVRYFLGSVTNTVCFVNESVDSEITTLPTEIALTTASLTNGRKFDDVFCLFDIRY